MEMYRLLLEDRIRLARSAAAKDLSRNKSRR